MRRSRILFAIPAALVLLSGVLPAQAAAPKLSVKDPRGDVQVTSKDGSKHTSQARALDILSVTATTRKGGAIIFTITTLEPLTNIAPGKDRSGQLGATLCPVDAADGCNDGVLVTVPLPATKLIAGAFRYQADGTARYCLKQGSIKQKKNVVTVIVPRMCLNDRTKLVASAVTMVTLGSGDKADTLTDPTGLSPVGSL